MPAYIIKTGDAIGLSNVDGPHTIIIMEDLEECFAFLRKLKVKRREKK